MTSWTGRRSRDYYCTTVIKTLLFLIRGNKLEDVSNISQNLASESKKYKFSAQQMSFLVSFTLNIIDAWFMAHTRR